MSMPSHYLQLHYLPDTTNTGKPVHRRDSTTAASVIGVNRLMAYAKETVSSVANSLVDVWVDSPHNPLRIQLRKEIDASRYFLAWEDDWDDEGSVAYQQATWERAGVWVSGLYEKAPRSLCSILPIPRILPGPDGSIDLHWKAAHGEVLLNIPANINAMAGYYGDSTSGACIKGKLPLASDEIGLSILATVAAWNQTGR